MGRSVTPTFVVNYRDQTGAHWAVWNTKLNGKPTPENLERWRVGMNDSMKIGGVNEHVSRTLGFLPHISKATIHNQKSGCDVATVKAPLFEVA